MFEGILSDLRARGQAKGKNKKQKKKAYSSSYIRTVVVVYLWLFLGEKGLIGGGMSAHIWKKGLTITILIISTVEINQRFIESSVHGKHDGFEGGGGGGKATC